MTDPANADAWAENKLVAQARSLGALIRDEASGLAERLHKVVPVPVEYGIRQLFLVGCGDSAMAASATQQAFRRFSGIPTVAEEAMTFARYTAPLFGGEYPFTPTVVAISNSGEVARVVEAANNARAAGGYVVGLVGNPESRLAQASDVVVTAKAPSFPSAPGTRSYMMTLLALATLAIRFGEVRGRTSLVQGKKLRKELIALGEAVETGLQAAEQTLAGLAHDWVGVERVDVLGSGPDRGSAMFGAAKILEATGIPANAVDVEEFFHLNYFANRPEKAATIVIGAPNAPSASRVTELAPVLERLGRPTLWLGRTDLPGRASLALPETRPEFAPIVTAGYLSTLAGMMMQLRGDTPGRGHDGPWALSAGGAATRQSDFWTADSEAEAAAEPVGSATR